MSRLHEALAHLRPKEFSDVPLDELERFMKEIFAQAEIIANSVPPAPGGDDTHSSKPTQTEPNTARDASEIVQSRARLPTPPEFVELQKSWGKPVNKPSKDNPLGITVYKMAANDRHGAWFARTSVHEGLGFTKWKRAMQTEFAESLAIHGAPGEGSVRGIGADQRVESRTIEGLGKLEVYQLSAKFPAPTAPRDFISMMLTSENALRSATSRHYIVISIPVSHPEVPPRDGLVHGTYESVEMIREVPLQPSKAASTTDLHDTAKSGNTQGRARGTTLSFTESRGPEAKGEQHDLGDTMHGEAELNPVEWVMITRSDPGGGIPRFMVERGTPGSIVADTSKFLNWACAKTEAQLTNGIDSKELVEHHTPTAASHTQTPAVLDTTPQIADRPQSAPEPSTQESTGGIVSTLASAIPQSLQNVLPGSFQPASSSDAYDGEITDESDTSDSDSFASADEGFDIPPMRVSRVDSDDVSLSSTTANGDTRQNKELEKLRRRRDDLDAKFAKQRQLQDEATRDAATKSEDAVNKLQERHEREKRKQEEKYQKEVEKLEKRREKEAKKLADKMKKEQDKTALGKAQRERDEYKQKSEMLEKENKILLEQVRDLQKESATLQLRLSGHLSDSGSTKSPPDDVEKARVRANTGASSGSVRSGLSRQVTTNHE